MNGPALNDAQLRAVTHDEGPLLVLAGPGTGKTRVLAHRMAHLVHGRGIDPGRILAITFTNKAANEIASRVSGLIGQAGRDSHAPFVATFHGWALSFLRGEMGASARLAIDEREAALLVRKAMEGTGIPPSRFRHMVETISHIKGRGDPVPGNDETEACFHAYQGLLARFGLWDFDDLLAEALRLLDDPAVRDQFRKRFASILVDEFQDVSGIQYELLLKMAPPGGDIAAIGDPNQAIYGFRGASPAFMERFSKDFQEASVIPLDMAYRSPQTFLDAASRVIRNPARLVSSRQERPAIQVRTFPDPDDEAAWIAGTIEDIAGGLSFEAMHRRTPGGDLPRRLSDIAVLVRVKALGDAVARALASRGIPYQCCDAADPFDGRDLRVLSCAWRAARMRASPYHAESLARELGGISSEEIGGILSKFSRLCGVALLDAFIEEFSLRIPVFMRSGLARGLDKNPDVDSLSVLFRNGVDLLDPGVEAVSLLTLHASKGLEFPVVFIAGCEDGIIPWTGADEAEERRLFYVGMTRASEALYMTRTRKRPLFGKVMEKACPFIAEIPPNLIEEIDHAGKARARRRPRQNKIAGF